MRSLILCWCHRFIVVFWRPLLLYQLSLWYVLTKEWVSATTALSVSLSSHKFTQQSPHPATDIQTLPDSLLRRCGQVTVCDCLWSEGWEDWLDIEGLSHSAPDDVTAELCCSAVEDRRCTYIHLVVEWIRTKMSKHFEWLEMQVCGPLCNTHTCPGNKQQWKS